MKKVIIIVLLLFAVFVVTGYLLPKHVHVERAITVDRPAAMMFELLNSYQHYHKWSPWVGRDPKAEFIISGPDSGVGARMSWIGDPTLVGSGWQEIISSKPYEQINIKLDFDAQGIADTGFKLVVQADATQVIWFFDSDLTQGVSFPNSFLARYFGLLFDQWVGQDYELGLANLKQYAESIPVTDFNQLEIEQLQVTAQEILFVRSNNNRDPADITRIMAAAYAEISDFMTHTGINMSGQPMVITRVLDRGSYHLDAAIPVDVIPAELSGHINAGLSPSGPAVRAVHYGQYDQITSSYEKLVAYMSAHGLKRGEVSWEHYISDPGNTAQAERVTHIYIMLEAVDSSL